MGDIYTDIMRQNENCMMKVVGNGRKVEKRKMENDARK